MFAIFNTNLYRKEQITMYIGSEIKVICENLCKVLLKRAFASIQEINKAASIQEKIQSTHKDLRGIYILITLSHSYQN
jgi:hypothetical protein